MSDSSERKTDPASQRKLQRQREKGVVSQAAEMANYTSQFLAILILMGTARWILSVMHLGIDNALITMASPFEAALEKGRENSIRIYLFSAAPIGLAALSSGILIKLIYQKGFVLAIDPILPKLDKISPAKGFQRIFGMRGWVELGLAIARLLVWTGSFAVLAYAKFFAFLAAVPCGLSCLVEVGLDTVKLMLIIACILFVVFAAVEGLIQKFLFAHEQRMTKTEVARERKDQFGSKEVRSARKKFRKELENSAEALGVDNATMALFFGDEAVAIRYHPDYAAIPILSAKARTAADSRKLRQQVRENGWQEAESQKVVSGLIARATGETVPEELYQALSAALVAMYAQG